LYTVEPFRWSPLAFVANLIQPLACQTGHPQAKRNLVAAFADVKQLDDFVREKRIDHKMLYAGAIRFESERIAKVLFSP
jgi:hypothetical protein